MVACVVQDSKLEIQAQTDQIIKNLQHENTMIATAWYDLSSRLQSNHFVLQRRHEMPKSWLNKQRQLVNGECSTLDECITSSSRLRVAQLEMTTANQVC